MDVLLLTITPRETILGSEKLLRMSIDGTGETSSAADTRSSTYCYCPLTITFYSKIIYYLICSTLELRWPIVKDLE